ncbi:ATPase, P-type (transporting), HAD superfamily, subfamily IC [Bellilinea caldifistulae]|uniref:cation-translocating P-type ATPase n=1 Tax=Bellilinea caldifistulae TaxID=360411 RepID=UPI0009E541C1|nr:HAD-IC family P-type ATPase [Bellilinea caldifistulae]GAP09579.1 ATPase, P-type (transporting), HAD superfamily, subfamily IC [Bellilinea caldifistulae]
MRPEDLDINRIEFTESGKKVIAWHAEPLEVVYRKLQSLPDGLSEEQVAERLREFGRNTLPTKEPPTLLQVFLHQFASPLIYILLIAGIVALLMQDYKDAVFIFAVILLNAVIGTIQEWRAEQSAHALQVLLKIKARVRRNGRILTVPAEEVVPGDILLVESGDKVAADLRLIQVNNLRIDESFLTGESLAVEKTVEPLPADSPVSDRRNMAYAGSTVMSGRGIGIVVATGPYTEVGKIAKTISEEAGAKPPLVIRMEKFSRQIAIVVLGFTAILGMIQFARGEALSDVFILVVAMAVSAIPEGLPVAMTVALSLATNRMARRNVIVRKLTAVESLGSCTLIASDKTGTLTVNQQTVKQILLPEGTLIEISGQGYNDEGEVRLAGDAEMTPEIQGRLLTIARESVLCNEATLEKEDGKWQHTGDAMDVALLALGYKLGIDPPNLRRQVRILDEAPFESEKRYAAVVYENAGEPRLVVKGAVETVLQFCSRMMTAQGEVPLEREKVLQLAQHKAESGFRVLALAAGEGNLEALKGGDAGLTLLGLLGFIDPLRPEVKEAVQNAQMAGIKVVMITGDHPATALAIARELGIAQSPADVITGKELAEIGSPEIPEFFEGIKHKTVFARVTPDQKLQIVDALIRLGEFVAVTGDGVNDAPALKKANIGVAMGSGTDIAKDTASMIVTDDNFASIVAGVEEGRFAYANVRKVTLLLISTGFAELVLLALAILMEFPVPLIAVQILWLNLVTNGIQDVALAFEGGEEGVMRQPPRNPSEGIFNRKMIEQLMISGLTMALVCLGVWVFLMREGYTLDSARNLLLALLVLMQFYHVLNCRSEVESAFKIPFSRNRVLAVGMLVALALHILATEVPFLQSLLRTESLPVQTWLILFALASVVLVVMEIYKAIQKRRALI